MSEAASYRLRDARPEDCAAILEVLHSAIQGVPAEFYPQHMRDAWDPNPASPEFIERLKGRLGGEAGIALVAETGAGEIAGYGFVKLPDAELHSVYVAAHHSRRGIGRLLLLRLEERAKAAGLAGLHLHAAINAERFYLAHGYVSEGNGEREMRDGVRIACICMRKQL
jgi:GNAT superfamily N-acetyltransferase